jgi:hypothetical protein
MKDKQNKQGATYVVARTIGDHAVSGDVYDIADARHHESLFEAIREMKLRDCRNPGIGNYLTVVELISEDEIRAVPQWDVLQALEESMLRFFASEMDKVAARINSFQFYNN